MVIFVIITVKIWRLTSAVLNKRWLSNNLTTKYCDNMEKLKTILVKSKNTTLRLSLYVIMNSTEWKMGINSHTCKNKDFLRYTNKKKRNLKIQ